MNEVLDFIKGFEPARDLFLYGYCYWFAMILSQRFKGRIWYMPVENHFVCAIKGRYYDAGGEVIPKRTKMCLWDCYPDEIEKARIIRDCINKEPVQ